MRLVISHVRNNVDDIFLHLNILFQHSFAIVMIETDQITCLYYIGIIDPIQIIQFIIQYLDVLDVLECPEKRQIDVTTDLLLIIVFVNEYQSTLFLFLLMFEVLGKYSVQKMFSQSR